MDFLASPLWISFKIALVATMLSAVFGVTLARTLPLLRRPGRLVGEALILIPMVLPPTVLGYGL